ncbi:unnamed protein product [Clonostachys rosea]|uniref:Fucose-specific lectin n=1 Tax=Bionectria ochroleuca TaxID=29856 RepID=A0ABY6UVN3_BIOOC|nr:unnamed protein product [Clonostachys rosea]
MRDDERYPMVVEPDAFPIPAYSDIPEVVASPDPDIQGHDKLSVPEKDIQPPSDGSGEPEVKRVCGFRKKRIVLLVAAIITVGAILGCVLGGLAATGRLANKKDSDETPSSVSSSIADSPQQSRPIDKTQRNVAASVSSGAKGSDVQLFYQALDSTTISYRRIVNDKAKTEQKASLTIEPVWGTPMTAAAINGSNPLRTQLFYLSMENNRTKIVEATFECQGDSELFSTVSNTVISDSAERLVHPETKLSALRLGDDLLRVFYQQTDNSIHAFSGDDGSGWYDNRVRKSAYPGTAIAVIAAERKEVHLFYVGLTTPTLRVSIYDDQLGPKATSDEVDDGTPSSDWRPTNSLAGVHVASNESFRCYWSQPKNGDIYSYWRDGAKWTGIHKDCWGRVEGGFAGVGWSDQVRLYYFQDGKLVVSAQDSETWEKPMAV